jgi:hypothetical protein
MLEGDVCIMRALVHPAWESIWRQPIQKLCNAIDFFFYMSTFFVCGNKFFFYV